MIRLIGVPKPEAPEGSTLWWLNQLPDGYREIAVASYWRRHPWGRKNPSEDMFAALNWGVENTSINGELRHFLSALMYAYHHKRPTDLPPLPKGNYD